MANLTQGATVLFACACGLAREDNRLVSVSRPGHCHPGPGLERRRTRTPGPACGAGLHFPVGVQTSLLLEVVGRLVSRCFPDTR